MMAAASTGVITPTAIFLIMELPEDCLADLFSFVSIPFFSKNNDPPVSGKE